MSLRDRRNGRIGLSPCILRPEEGACTELEHWTLVLAGPHMATDPAVSSFHIRRNCRIHRSSLVFLVFLVNRGSSRLLRKWTPVKVLAILLSHFLILTNASFPSFSLQKLACRTRIRRTVILLVPELCLSSRLPQRLHHHHKPFPSSETSHSTRICPDSLPVQSDPSRTVDQRCCKCSR